LVQMRHRKAYVPGLACHGWKIIAVKAWWTQGTAKIDTNERNTFHASSLDSRHVPSPHAFTRTLFVFSLTRFSSAVPASALALGSGALPSFLLSSCRLLVVDSSRFARWSLGLPSFMLSSCRFFVVDPSRVARCSLGRPRPCIPESRLLSFLLARASSSYSRFLFVSTTTLPPH